MIKIFDNISAQNKAKLLRILKAQNFTFKKDTSILSTVKLEQILGIITKGYAEIIRTDHNGNRTIIEELEEEDIFGTEISSLKNKEYDLVTLEDTEIIVIDYNNILNCEENNKSFYNTFTKNLLQIFTTKIKDKNERLEIITKKTIRNKLLEYFSIMSKKHGSKYVYLPFTFTALADYLAIDRTAMARELKNLKDEGFIEVKGKRITLLYQDY